MADATEINLSRGKTEKSRRNLIKKDNNTFRKRRTERMTNKKGMRSSVYICIHITVADLSVATFTLPQSGVPNNN